MESSNYVDLPAEIIREILLRLPVRDLLRFKCVCKHWCSIIGNQSFINEHFGHGSNRERLLIRHSISDDKPYAFALYVDDSCSAYEEPDNLQMPDAIADLLGPVNGVFCMVNRSDSMALLNPAMKQFKPLPSFDRNFFSHMSSFFNLHGFGLDALTGDFKIVCLQYFCNDYTEEPDDPSLVSVYSSGTNSWRLFEDPGFVFAERFAEKPLCNTYLNGSYYWLLEYHYGDEDEDLVPETILAFDMTSEKFRDINIPWHCIRSEERYLTVYNDTIALLSCDLGSEIDRCIDIWVMEKEGCWMKISTVVPFVNFGRPLGFSTKNELLLETRTSPRKLHNVSTNKLMTVQVRHKACDSFLGWIFCYKESLVSLKGEGGCCKLWDTSSDFIKDFFK